MLPTSQLKKRACSMCRLTLCGLTCLHKLMQRVPYPSFATNAKYVAFYFDDTLCVAMKIFEIGEVASWWNKNWNVRLILKLHTLLKKNFQNWDKVCLFYMWCNNDFEIFIGILMTNVFRLNSDLAAHYRSYLYTKSTAFLKCLPINMLRYASWNWHDSKMLSLSNYQFCNALCHMKTLSCRDTFCDKFGL